MSNIPEKFLSSVKKIWGVKQFYKTGFPELDVLLGGGFPKGSVIKIIGEENSGKTTILGQIFHTIKSNLNIDCSWKYDEGNSGVNFLQITHSIDVWSKPESSRFKKPSKLFICVGRKDDWLPNTDIILSLNIIKDSLKYYSMMEVCELTAIGDYIKIGCVKILRN